MKSIYNLLLEQILAEGRREEAIAKYPNVPTEIVDKFVEGEGLPADAKNVWKKKDNKYLEWMVGVYNEGEREVEEIVNLVKNFYEKETSMTEANIKDFISDPLFSEQFSDNGGNLENLKKNPKEIKNYPNFATLNIFVNFLNNKVSKAKKEKEIKMQGHKIAKGEYDGRKFEVISPTTHAASCQYGRNSRWCVTVSDPYHYHNYTKKGTLYFFIQTNEDEAPMTPKWADSTLRISKEGEMGQEAGVPPFKTALLIQDDGETSWWSKADSRYDGWVGSSNLEWFTQDIADKVLEYNKKSIANRKERQIQTIIKSAGFYKRSGGDNTLKNDFSNLLGNGIFKAEQLVDIIKNGNEFLLIAASSDGEKVRKILGKEKVFNLLKNIVSNLSVSSGALNNFLLEMDGQKFLTSYLNKECSNEECKSLADILIKKIGSKGSASQIGSDVKMFIDKWTLSPEEMQKYLSTSSYFFVGIPETIEDGDRLTKKLAIEDLTKVDRFDPNTHDALTLMMYGVNKRKSSNPKVGLYIVMTDRDALDPYIGQDNEDIPDSVRELIENKARKVPS